MIHSNDLPLSWIRGSALLPTFQILPLRYSRMNWFSLASIPRGFPITSIFKQMEQSADGGIILRGCNKHLSRFFCTHGFQSVLVGGEAVLNLNNPDHFSKKSLRELIKRGQRHGRVREIQWTEKNIKRINQLKKDSRHGAKPQLKHLFINTFDQNTRCFTFLNDKHNWLAALSISHIDESRVQSELLIRHQQAPAGTMEALIFETFRILKKEGIESWSLGEVPFINKQDNITGIKEKLIQRLGKVFRFAYDYKGLYQFKNKFRPEWQDIYLCGRPKISLLTIAEIFIKSQLLALVYQTLRHAVKTGPMINKGKTLR